MVSEHAQKLREVAAQLSTESFQGWSNPLATVITDAADFLDGSEQIDTGDAVISRPTPVAPVSPGATGKCGELVRLSLVNGGGLEPNQNGNYVRFSQAVELLAAERAEKEDLIREWAEAVAIRDADIRSLKDLNSLHVSANAALTARVKELEAALDSDPSGSDLWRYWSRKACEASQKYVDEVDRAEALEANLAAKDARIKELEDKRIEDRFTVVDEMEKREALGAKLAAAEKALTEIASFTQTTDLLWWQERARTALGGKPS
ncbi:hypothetical protein ACI50E_18865 [Brucella sp. ZJ1_1]|uniref:hypothetical protein n=1 Tax=Brucella sp. ZJ1_1 TaxID=3379097 RepID=UPI003852CBC3